MTSVVVRAIDTTLVQIRDDAEHPLRERFDDALATFIDDLHNSPAVIAKAEALKARAAGHPGDAALLRHTLV